MNTSSKPRSLLGAALTLGALALVASDPALADSTKDVFASGKEIIKATAGKGSAIEKAMLGTGLLTSIAGGFMARNWMGAIGGFAAGCLLWEVCAPMVGLA
ncbi:type IV conjugative transfer system pilin TraA [Vibrio pectenicida]|uniref:type IV conjugative transfer system pilin TraA n=1 Tax=Vibrio pectenicida TaxID=62763 RepID=UPI003B9C833E